MQRGQQAAAEQPTWRAASAQAAPALDQAAAVHRAADWDCQGAVAQWALAVPRAAPRQVAREVEAVRSDQAAPALAEGQEAASGGSSWDCHSGP